MDIKTLSDQDLVKFIKAQVKEHETSSAFKNAEQGKEYYDGNQDIDNKQRIGCDDEGRPVVLRGLPNVIAKDNQYSRLVDQKVQYVLSETPKISCDDDEHYAEMLVEFLDKRFMRTWLKIARDAMNCGIGWMFVYPKDNGLGYKKINPLDIIPIWQDSEKESLSALLRKRTDSVWDTNQGKLVQKHFIELYTDAGVTTYEIREGTKYTKVSDHGYFKDKDGNQFNWGKIPFIYWRYSADDITLLSRVKSLIDIQNLILSVFGDRMLEDNRNTVLVLKGYDGENPYEVRGEMNNSGVLQVSGDGAVDTLNIEINADNFEKYLRLIEEKIIKNARAVDTKNDRTNNAPNELNIKSMYNDIELDANGMENEFQASFEHLQWFFKRINKVPEHLLATLEFKRNIMVNRSEDVSLIRDSEYLSLESKLENNPLVTDVAQELERIKQEQTEDLLNDPAYFPAVQDVMPDEQEE